MSIARRRALRLQHIPEFLVLLAAALEAETRGARTAFGGGVQSLRGWIEDFYPEQNRKLATNARPVVRAYGELIANAALSEINALNTRFDPDALAESYSAGLADRWTNDSISQLRALLRDEEADEFEEQFTERMDTWSTGDRAKLSAEREGTQAGAAFVKIAFMSAGVEKLVWVAGGDACPLCQKMNNKTVSITEPFVKAGETVDPEDGETTPLVTTQVIGHPPLHGMGGKGGVCDCLVVAG